MSESTVPQPLVGELPPRWNFNGVLSGILIPKCVALYRRLPPGARLLWGIIRTLSKRDGFSDASDATLAKRLGVSTRQIQRYCRALEARGFLETELRRGTTARRWLLLHPAFKTGVAEPRDISVTGVGHIRHGGVTHPSPTVNLLREPSSGEPFASVQVSRLQVGPTNGLKPLATLLDRTFTEPEKTALKANVTALGFDLTPELLGKLQRKAAFYGANGFQVAAAIARAAKVAERRPSTAPVSPAWFTAVVENALAHGKSST